MYCLSSSVANTTTFIIPNTQSSSKLHQHCYRNLIGTSRSIVHHSKLQLRFRYLSTRAQFSVNPQISGDGDDDSQTLVQDLRVPHHWLVPSKALEESEWLKVTLRKWLDDEYCPEETNVEISEVAALSFYNSLLDKQTDLGDILLQMALALESISYQESFHGAFSSANAAVSLIIQRLEQD